MVYENSSLDIESQTRDGKADADADACRVASVDAHGGDDGEAHVVYKNKQRLSQERSNHRIDAKTYVETIGGHSIAEVWLGVIEAIVVTMME